MPHPDAVADVLLAQDGVVARHQARAASLTQADIARLLRRREWARVHPGVYVDHTGPLSWQQRAWAGVLFSWPAALWGVSALQVAEGPGGRHREQVIHVAVDRQRHLVAPPGVRVHRVAGLHHRVWWNLAPPRLRYDDAVVDVALAQTTDLDTIAILAEACGSRRTTAARLLEVVAERARVPRRDWVRRVLTDIAGGTHSVLEHGYLTRVERAHGLPRARRQLREVTATGVVYRDARYAQGLVVELDGRLVHDTAAQRERDHERDLDAAVAEGHLTVRLSFGQVFDRPCRTASKVAALLQQRGWRGSPRACGPSCVAVPEPRLAG